MTTKGNGFDRGRSWPALRVVAIDRELAGGRARRVGGSDGVDVAMSHPERPFASARVSHAVLELHESLDRWVNEGGAGGEVKR